MFKKTYPIIAVVFLCLCQLLFNPSAFALQNVKIQDGRLWVLASDNGTYIPYFIKAVGYQPTPIGRYPSDWGYDPTDPRSTNNNIYDDPAILNRDFSLLQQMNANTIRIWKGDNSQVSCPCSNNGRYPDYITQNTLDIAAQYGLKVIAGFWVNFLTFDQNNNIGSIDYNGNPITSQQIINNFVNYVNALKGNKAILFWAIGNENNYEVLNAGTVSKTAFESAFGLSYGDTIFNWLQQTANILDFDGGITVDLNSSVIVDELKAQYPLDYNLILTTLKQFSGQRLTPQQLTAWYGLVNAMALAAHQAEGSDFHPVALVNGDIAEIGNSADGTTDSQMPDLDIWGANVYRGKSFGTFFEEYSAKSQKPLWISEFGIDAWSVANATGINDWGLTLAEDLGGTGTYAPQTQTNWDVALWDEIFNHSSVAIGGSVMEYSDEWWKPYEFYCTNPQVPQFDNAISAGICNSNQKYFGNPFPVFPDGFMNQEWFGIMSISKGSSPGSPDIMSTRPVYNKLQKKWQSDPWPRITLNLTGNGAGTMTSSPGGLNCTSGSTNGCSSEFEKNQPVFLNFTFSNNSYVGNWGGCSPVSATECRITPDRDIVLNIALSFESIITASAGTGGVISPSGAVSVKSGADRIFVVSAKHGYRINQVLVDGKAVKLLAGAIYIFKNVTAAHTITASFSLH